MIGRAVGGERGSVSVQALVLLGLFMLLLAFVAEVGALRAKTMRVQSAFDRAALAAAGAFDAAALADRGEIVLDAASADAVARRYLRTNLEPLEEAFSGQSAAQVAAAARVATASSPRPAVTLSGEVNLPTGLLALAGIGGTRAYTIHSSSQLKGP